MQVLKLRKTRSDTGQLGNNRKKLTSDQKADLMLWLIEEERGYKETQALLKDKHGVHMGLGTLHAFYHREQKDRLLSGEGCETLLEIIIEPARDSVGASVRVVSKFPNRLRVASVDLDTEEGAKIFKVYHARH